MSRRRCRPVSAGSLLVADIGLGLVAVGGRTRGHEPVGERVRIPAYGSYFDDRSPQRSNCLTKVYLRPAVDRLHPDHLQFKHSLAGGLERSIQMLDDRIHRVSATAWFHLDTW
jgi:hypothetical protein